jgi:arginyl-tRNA synthetase
MSHGKIEAALCAVLRQMGVEQPTVQLERPRDLSHGDVASNVAMTLARELKRSPRQIAEQIAESLDLEAAGVEAVEVAGSGFLNFRLSSGVVASVLRGILVRDEAWGRSETGGGERVMVEFVSANPTGPLHIGHGRQAALGDAIASLLTWTGWQVHREFYYNNVGLQMESLALSVHARYLQHFGLEAEIPEGGYHGGYITEIAEGLAQEVGDRYVRDFAEQSLDEIRAFVVPILRAEQDRDLNDFRVFFDEFYLESSLYSEGRVEAAIQALKDTGLVYEHEGATWFKTTEFGDQKDRVMVRSNGLPTYFVPDVAYHLHKWQRGFHRVINGFVVQGGDPTGTGRGGPGYRFADELPPPGRYELGSLVMANAGPDTNGSQFFIITGPSGVGLPPQYSLFGQVVKGLDVADAMQKVSTGPGDRPVDDVVIESVTISEGSGTEDE